MMEDTAALTFILHCLLLILVSADRIKQGNHCKYKRAQWSVCDSHEQTQTLVQSLTSGSAAQCQLVIVTTRTCVAELQMVEPEVKKTQVGITRDRKNGKEHHRKRKQKNRNQMQLKINKKSNSKGMPHELPLPPAELNVQPQATSAFVSWQSPLDETGKPISVDSYKIGYGQGFPDLNVLQVDGQEVAYRIDNLEPGREYIVSLRAKTKWGVSQPLYETITTQTVGEVLQQTVAPPVGVKSTVISPDAINVTWVHVTQNEMSADIKMNYYVRYKQLNHLTGQTPHKHDYQIQHTFNTYVVINDLLPFTKYEFSVMASDGERNSSWSVMAWNVTLQAASLSQSTSADIGADLGQQDDGDDIDEHKDAKVAGPVRNLHVDILSSTSAVATWQDPGLLQTIEDETTSDVPTYSVSYRNLDEKLSNYSVMSSPFTTLYVLDLAPMSWYEFRVKVHRGHQESDWSLPVRNRTFVPDHQVSLSLGKPVNLQATIMSPNSALISWQQPHLVNKNGDTWPSPPPACLTYMLRYRDVTRKPSPYMFASPTLTSIYMVDLEPATKYEFSVRAVYYDQHSDWTVPVVNTTFYSAPSTGPSHVTISLDNGDPTTALLTWQPPLVPNGNITGYIVFYETVTERKSATVAAGELSYRVPFLKPHTKYFFRVGAWNNQGFSPLSNRVVHRTPRVVGLPPTDVTVSPASDDLYNAIVSWQPPSFNKRKIKFYTVSYYTEDGKQRTVIKVPAYTLTTMAKKLLPSTVYHFIVQAHYQRDSGPHSHPVQFSIPKELL